MRIAVVGGMGAVAQEVVAQALECGHLISWMISPADQLPDASLETDYTQVLHIVRSPWDSESEYVALLSSCDAVIVALDIHSTDPSHFVPIQRLVQKAMRSRKVHRIILITAHGSGESSRQLDWELWLRINVNQLAYSLFGVRALCWSIAAQYSEQERVLEQSGLKYTILRPASVVDGPTTGTYLASPSHIYGGYISAGDVADCALKALDNEMDISQAFSIAYSSRVA
ncbi:hypothetical protein IWW36_001035 [Coemansia brasiliensis]|uniref:NAD(P)-binding domain-containing protein n=1 Tax=Coemansia brasiliensis TaxID=2650707 RepID=A0A9W8I9S9_9FUNG|nr:hypothetical protein IWW36_001035 [Coemansia brasiliensis]